MRHTEASLAILAEVDRASLLYPDWPVDPVHAAAVLAEESGETVQAALDYCYSDGELSRIQEEAIQAGAMAMRILMGLDNYERLTGYKK
jgi:hypothetical protein